MPPNAVSGPHPIITADEMKVAVIAFGTRGDVQPLAIVAAGLASSSAWCSEVVVVTHKQHAHFVESLFTIGSESESLVEIATVDSPPVLWKGTPEFDAAAARANLSQQHGCMEACRGAGLVVFNMFALEGFHVSEAYSIPCAVCHPYLTATTMPSSFPATMRRTHPRLFRRLTRLSDKPRMSPEAGRDHLATTSEGSGEGHPSTPGRCRETAWAHVEHWMWPLFTDRWGPFRESLGLDPCPFQEDEAVKPSGRGEESLSAKDDGVVDALRIVDPRQLPLVLYLFSPLVVDVSPFWPQCVRICGYLFPSPATTVQGKKIGQKTSCSLDIRQRLALPPAEQPHQLRPEPTRASDRPASGIVIEAGHHYPARGKRHNLSPDVEAFLSARDDRPIYVGFGSMWGMCSPGYRLAFALRVLLLGARQAGCRCVVSLPTREHAGVRKDTFEKAGRMRELDSATEWVLGELAASEGQGDLLVHQGPIAHDLLLPRCSVAIHHGGSGTTAAVLRAGIPHVVCPQQLDQFFWAERVRYLAVGAVLERSLFVERDPSPTEPPGSLVCQASAAILSTLTPQAKLRAACLGVKIRAENGLENALDSLSLYLSKRPPTVAVPRYRPNTGAKTDTALSCTATPTATSERACAEEAGGEEMLVGGVASQSYRGCGEGDGVRVGKDVGEEELVLREMPNGLQVWGGRGAEAETFFIYGEVFEDRTYARMGIRVQDGDTVWDVGANVGLASIFFELETDTPDSLHVYAFEPVPFNSTALKRNMSIHCPTAVVLPYALGAKREDGVPATFYPRMPGNSTLRPLEKERLQGGMGCTAGESFPSERKVPANGSHGRFFQDAQQVTCSVRTVSWAMAHLGVDRIDLLKIDVEGSELDVLLGVGERDWPKIRQVVAEVHPVGDRVMRACNLLRDHGFDVSAQALGLDGAPLSPSRGVRTAADYAANKDDTNAISLNTSGAAFPRKEQSKLHHGRLEAALKGTINATEHLVDAAKDGTMARDRYDEAGLQASTRGDHQGDGDVRTCWLNDAAEDRVVFMVYAKR